MYRPRLGIWPGSLFTENAPGAVDETAAGAFFCDAAWWRKKSNVERLKPIQWLSSDI
jgi:hypothetical protein